MLLPSFFYHLSFELYPLRDHQAHLGNLKSKQQQQQQHKRTQSQSSTSSRDSHTYFLPPPRTNIFKVNLPDHGFDFAQGLGSASEPGADTRKLEDLRISVEKGSDRTHEPASSNTKSSGTISDSPLQPRDCRFGLVDIQSIEMVSHTAGQSEAKGKSSRDLSSELGQSLAGPATKARFIPSDPKSTHLGVGVVHLYRDVEETPGLYDDGPPPPATKSLGAGLGAGDSKSTFDEKDCTTLCILAVPSYLSPSDFMGFVGEKTREEVSHFRMIRTERTNRYMVLMKFREARKARAWRKEWNGKAFDSMGPETCHVVFIKSIHFQTPDGSSDPSSFPNMANDPFTPSPPHAHAASNTTDASLSRTSLSVKPVAPPTPSLVELPTCPVCLERMDETTGLLTIVCQHVFHCECLHKWRGSGCPICRYTQGQGLYGADGSSSVLHKEDIVKECSVCASDTNLWICLICGNVGCGRYDEAHAFAHYTATSHSYAMDLVTQRVWDYAGDGYVHRLIHNTPDGKFVDLHSSTSLYNSDYPLDYTYSSSDNLLLSSSRADADNVPCNDATDEPRHSNAPDDPNTTLSDPTDEKLKTHLDSMGMEYTHLLTCQLESQRAYFEEKLVRAADKASHASATAESALTASSRAQADLADLQAAYDRLTTDTIPTLERDKMRAENRADKFERTARFLEKEYKEEKAINESLLERIKFMESQLSTLRGENEDLKELNRDLGFYLSAGEKLRELGGGGGGGGNTAEGDAGGATNQPVDATATATAIDSSSGRGPESAPETGSGRTRETGSKSHISAQEIEQASISIADPPAPASSSGQRGGRKSKGKRRAR